MVADGQQDRVGGPDRVVLEQPALSALVATTGLALSGVVDFDMDLVGPVLAPDTDLRGRLQAHAGSGGVIATEAKSI